MGSINLKHFKTVGFSDQHVKSVKFVLHLLLNWHNLGVAKSFGIKQNATAQET